MSAGERSQRPAPRWEAPEGYMHVAREEGPDWSPVPRCSTGRCRRRGCRKAAVLSLNRMFLVPPTEGARGWWDYCEDHAYGRWLEDGKVMHWVMRFVLEAVQSGSTEEVSDGR